MMAFFDSLVQREIEGWSSEDVPTAPQTPSGDSEINPVTGEPYSESEFDGTPSFMFPIFHSATCHSFSCFEGSQSFAKRNCEMENQGA